jgi:hypothetical protein
MEKLAFSHVLVDMPTSFPVDSVPAVRCPPGFEAHALEKKKRREFAVVCQAIIDRNVFAVDALLENIDVNLQGDANETFLSVAVALDREEIMALLVQKGANYSLLDEEDKKKFIPFLLKIFRHGLENFLEQKRKEREKARREFLEEISWW